MGKRRAETRLVEQAELGALDAEREKEWHQVKGFLKTYLLFDRQSGTHRKDIHNRD